MTLNILADERLAGLEQHIAALGSLRCMPGREIRREHLSGQDVLLVRSITRVDRDLLEGTSVRFVGTATSGVDHVDLDYLQTANIAFTHAGGSNAEAVADYCLAGLAQAIHRQVLPEQGFSVGIVGCGQVGRRLAARLLGMGIAVRLCDPYVENRLGDHPGHPAQALFATLDAVSSADVITLHVPLVRSGAHPTESMIDRHFLNSAANLKVMINSCRGGVVDESALLRCIETSGSPFCITDVWRDEPAVNPTLVTAAQVATPHIAGYSSRAKLQATQMLETGLRAFLETGAAPDSDFKAAWHGSWQRATDVEPCWAVVREAVDLDSLTQNFKRAVVNAGEARLSADVFDAFRQGLHNRLEFSQASVDSCGLSAGQQLFLQAAGFSIGNGLR